MKRGYANRQVKDICTKGSSQVAQKDLGGLTGDYPIYGASGLIKNVDFYHQEKEYIGLVKDGSGIGRVMFLPPKSSVIGTLQYILPKEGYNIRYIGYCLQSLRLDKYKQGAAIPHIYFKDYGEAQILVADNPDEQQRIVALLDAEFAKIDALKANAEKNLQNAKDLFQAALKKLIIGGSKDWKSAKLKTICSKIGSGATPLGGKSTYGKEGVSLIRSLNVHNNEFHYEDLAHINEEQARQLSNVEIKEDDVLFNITGASVTRCCKVPKDVLPARVNQHVSILRLLSNTLLPDFLVYTMISPHHNSALMKIAENGATRQAITKKQLEEWIIEYPETIDDQQSIVARLDTLNDKCKTLQANYEKTLSLCDDLKQALLRKAFNGEI